MAYSNFLRAFVLGFSLLTLAPGCGPRLPSFPPEVHHIKKAWSLCGAYKANHNGKLPKDIDEVKMWALQEGKATEDDFTSRRDKQPYKVMCTPPPMGFILVFEQTGENGKRLVVPHSGSAVEVTEEEFQQMVKSLPKARNVPSQYRG
jgi:hypothetical protein